jgi:DUF2075 family protein
MPAEVLGLVAIESGDGVRCEVNYKTEKNPGKVIAAILSQESENGECQIVSTTSRILSPTERRYTVCEQELLAIVHALVNFRIYEGESNENRKTEIKIRNIAPLSYKLADMLPML